MVEPPSSASSALSRKRAREARHTWHEVPTPRRAGPACSASSATALEIVRRLPPARRGLCRGSASSRIRVATDRKRPGRVATCDPDSSRPLFAFERFDHVAWCAAGDHVRDGSKQACVPRPLTGPRLRCLLAARGSSEIARSAGRLTTLACPWPTPPTFTCTSTPSTRCSTAPVGSRSSCSARPISACPRSGSPTTARWPGAVELYKAAGKVGIKPLLGCEVYVVDDRRAAPALRGRARLEPPDAARRDDRRLPQPRQALHARLPRGLLLQAARRLRAARALRRRPDLPVGLHGRGHLPGAARGDEPAARAELDRLVSIFGRDDVYVELQDAGMRRARRDQPGAAAHRGRRRAAGRRHRRRALPARRGRRAARRAALHPDERAARGPEPLPLHDEGVLPQDPGRDADADGALGRRPARADARDRRALQRRARARRAPPAALRRGRGRQLRHAPPALRGGPRTALRRTSTTRSGRGSSSSCRRSARWASPTTS